MTFLWFWLIQVMRFEMSRVSNLQSPIANLSRARENAHSALPLLCHNEQLPLGAFDVYIVGFQHDPPDSIANYSGCGLKLE